MMPRCESFIQVIHKRIQLDEESETTGRLQAQTGVYRGDTGKIQKGPIDRQTDTQTDRQTERSGDKRQQTDRQTER